MRLTSTKVARASGGDGAAGALEDTGVRSITQPEHDPGFELLIGAFDHTDGRRAVMLTNYHFAWAQWVTVEFDAPAADVVEVDQWSGKEKPVVDDSPDMDGLQVSLDVGEGRLFLVPGD